MKKIYGFLALSIGFATLSSCSDDDNNSVAEDGIKVTAAATTIEAAGGSATVDVDKTVASAYSTDGWLSVSFNGTKVSATADKNASRESRSTTVIIKASANDSTIINVSQLGIVFGYDGENVMFGNDGGKAARYVIHNQDYTVTKTPSWVTTTVDGDSLRLNVSANNTGNMRAGYVYFASGNYTDSLKVTQADFSENICGDYYLFAYNLTTNSQIYTSAQVFEWGNMITLSLPDLGYTFDCTYDPSDLSLNFTSGLLIGTYANRYYVYEALLSASGYYAYGTTPTAKFPFEIDDETGLQYAYLTGDWFGEEVLGMAFFCTSSNSFSSDTNLGTVPSIGGLYGMTLIRLSGDEAKENVENVFHAKSKSLQNKKLSILPK